MFILSFDKSAGSETIYAGNGTVVAYYEAMVLQYFNPTNNKWVQSGTFQSLSWVKVDDYHYQVIKSFADGSTSPTTNYTITYDIRSDSRTKITISIESGATRQYRLHWSLDGIAYSSWQEMKNSDNVKDEIVFGDQSQSQGWIRLNWEDIYQQFKADVNSYSISTSAQGKKADLYFDLGTVSAGSVLTVDPSLVGTSGSSVMIAYPFQRKSFFTQGRTWVFWADATNIYYSTSTDGSTWSSTTTVRASGYGYTFSIWFDGTYIHYASANGGSYIYYRRGLPNADGTITWSAAEQAISASSPIYPFISVDSNGYPWIVYFEYTAAPYPLKAIKSSANDGTWPSSAVSSVLTTSSSNNLVGAIIPLTSGKMLAVYAYSGGVVKVNTWSGSAWGTAVSTASSIQSQYYFSAVAQGDDAHIVFLKATTYDIIYTKYTYSTNSFGTETTLQATATSSSAPVISRDPGTNDLYVFWLAYPSSTYLYYRKYTASTSTWETAVSSSRGTFTYNYDLSVFYNVYDNPSSIYLGYLYMLNAAAPYMLYYDYLGTYPDHPPNAPTLNSPPIYTNFNPLSNVTFAWTFSDPDAGDTQSAYELQIYHGVVQYDTGKVVSSSNSTTITLPSNLGPNEWYWQVKTWDSIGAEGPYNASGIFFVDEMEITSTYLDMNHQTLTVFAHLVYAGQQTGIIVNYAGINGTVDGILPYSAVIDFNSVSNIPFNSSVHPVMYDSGNGIITASTGDVNISLQKTTLPNPPFYIIAAAPFSNVVWDGAHSILSFIGSATSYSVFIPTGTGTVPNGGVPYYVQIDSTAYLSPGTAGTGWALASTTGGYILTINDASGGSTIIVSFAPFVPPGSKPSGETVSTQIPPPPPPPFPSFPSPEEISMALLNNGSYYLIAFAILLIGGSSLVAVSKSESVDDDMKPLIYTLASMGLVWLILEILFSSHAIPYGAFGAGLGQFLMFLFPEISLSSLLSQLMNPIIIVVALAITGISIVVWKARSG